MKHKFVRYGKLKAIKQKGYKKDTFHSAPSSKGFYAFPFGFEELFLVADLSYQHNTGLPKITKIETSKWYNRNTEEYEINIYDSEVRDIWSVKHNFEVDNNSLVWHHLFDYVLDKGKILSISKSWCQTTVAVWKKAFNRCINKQRMQHAAEWKISILELPTVGYYNNDHLEVFFNLKVK